jgi:hypothetical protein
MSSKGKDIRSATFNVGVDKFKIQTDLTDEELDNVVNYVTKKMNYHHRINADLSERHRLILVSLDIASELFDMRVKLKDSISFYQESQERLSLLAQLLDEELKDL